MDKKTVVAGLIAAFAIACGESAPTSGVSGSGAGMSGDDASRFDESAIAELIDGSRGGGGGEAGSRDGGSSDAGAGGEAAINDASDPELEPDSTVGEPCEHDSDGDGVCNDADRCPGYDDALDADGDGVCDTQDECDGHDDTIDADLDSVPDGCDTCPVGVSTLCDAVIWLIEMPHHSYSIAESADPNWFWVFSLHSPDADSYQVGLDLEADGVMRSYELGGTKLEQVRDYFSQHEALSATMGFMTASQSGSPTIASVDSECAFRGNEAVLSRVVISGRMQPNGVGSIRAEVRGYVLPAD